MRVMTAVAILGVAAFLTYAGIRIMVSADAAAASSMYIDLDTTGNTGAESGVQCFDALDNDGDTFVNDGCTSFSPPSESGAQCANDLDDDSDTQVNDGCPQGPSTLGPVNACVQVSAGATVTLDVVITGIPAYVDNSPFGVVDGSDTGGMTSFAFDLTDNAGGNFSIVAQSFSSFLLAANVGSSLFDASDVPPSSDGSFTASVLDSGSGVPEQGSGVLSRLTLSVNGATPSGVYNLGLTNNAHGGPDGFFLPGTTSGATLAVSQPCPGVTPTPTASPTAVATPTPSATPTASPGASPTPTASGGPSATPTPTPTPTPTVVASPTPTGGGGPTQTPTPTATPAGSATPIVSSTPSPTQPSGTPLPDLKGDMDCDGDVDAVDALLILKFLAGFQVILPPGCASVGS